MIPDIIKDPVNNPVVVTHEREENGEKITDIEYKIYFTNVSISKPLIQENSGATKIMTPHDARIRNTTYASPIYVDAIEEARIKLDNGEWDEVQTHKVQNLMIGKIPIMLGSDFCILSEKNTETKSELGECAYDSGGYFIINGSEKVLVSQEKMAENKPFVFHHTNRKYSDTCEIRSVNDGRYNSTKQTTVLLMAKDMNGAGKTVRVSIQGPIRNEIPIMMLFRALGIESEKKILEMIVYDLNDTEMIDLIKPSIEEGIIALSQQDAIKEIMKNINLNILSVNLTPEEKEEAKIKYVNDVLSNWLLPHVGENFEMKAIYLGYMVNRLFTAVLKRRNYDDRDHYANKKIDSAGVLLSYLFALNFRQKLIRTFQRDIRKDITNLRDGIDNIKIEKYIKPTIIDTGLKRSFSMGDWGLKQSTQHNKQGVSQVVNRINFKSALSHTRRVVTPLEKTSKKLVGPHILHGTQYGVLCPSETPDGEQIGINKNLALTCYITNQVSPEPVIEILKENSIEFIEETNISNIKYGCKIFVNGNWLGMHYKPDELYNVLIDSRRNGLIDIHTSVVWNHEYNELLVYTDAGRCTRPLYIVENNKIQLTNKIVEGLNKKKIGWQDLFGTKEVILENNKTEKILPVLEYIDCNEAEKILVASTPKDLEYNTPENPEYRYFTHCELHPSTIFGVVISEQPFSNHNQSPRVIYFGNMGKQGIGIPATNFNIRFDTMLHVLHYPQKPLVSTRISRLLPGKELTNGQMANVAIACYSGYNQEDSVITNQNALDRGLFVSTYYHRYFDEEKKNHQELQEEIFTKPTKQVINPKDNTGWSALDENGFAIIGKHVSDSVAVIGKLIPTKVGKDGIKKFKDASCLIKPGDSGYVDDVTWNINGDGYRFCKVKIRTVRQPQIGDKVASRHAQKGTIGMILPQEDMPFNSEGITPDVIINPHAIPTRMTIGQLIECLLGKVCCIKGFEGDGTPFNGVNVKDICKLLGNPIDKGGCGFTEYKSEDGEYSGYGDEILYNGMTGEQLRVKIFMGPTYYLRLKHMVVDKVHSRSHGPYQMLVKQPSEGRSREGGLRIGEMERDCMIAHGAAFFLKERMLDVSDLYKVYINRKNGLIAIGTPENGTLREDITDAKPVYVPYAFKLLLQELMAIGICPRLITW